MMTSRGRYSYCNGVGPDYDEIRTGNGMVLDPYGDVLIETVPD
jgi:hypothetical protein